MEGFLGDTIFRNHVGSASMTGTSLALFRLAKSSLLQGLLVLVKELIFISILQKKVTGDQYAFF